MSERGERTALGAATTDAWRRARVDRSAPATVSSAAGSMTVDVVPSDDGEIFTYRHAPIGPPIGTVLVCSPISKEWGTNHRREVLLSWELAAKGFAVQRFSYRGCGDSAGDPLEVTFDRMVADAEVALATTTTTTSGEGPLIVQGTRLGGLVAAAVAERHPEAGLVLWQPFVKGAAFFREVLRAQMIGDLKQGQKGSSTKESLAALEAAGSVDVLGDPIGWELYRSVADLSLLDVVTGPRSGLIIQMSRRKQVKSEYTKLAEAMAERGGHLDIDVVEDDEAWWFGARGGNRKLEIRAAALEVIPLTVRFAAEQLGAPVEAGS